MNKEYPIEEELEEAYKTINQLTNNWNELEEYIIEQMKLWDRDVYLTYKEVLDKMNEIKGDNQ